MKQTEQYKKILLQGGRDQEIQKVMMLVSQ
jgi:hypothetical protein